MRPDRLLAVVTLVFVALCANPVLAAPEGNSTTKSAENAATGDNKRALACVGNTFCRFEAARQLTNLVDYSAEKTKSGLPTELLLNPVHYWPWMADVKDCSSLADKADRLRCGIYQTHATLPLAACASLPKDTALDQYDKDAGEVANQPRLYCIELHASKMTRLGQCENDALSQHEQGLCKQAYRRHGGMKTCPEFDGEEKGKCLQQAGLYDGTTLKHCQDDYCVMLTMGRNFITQQPLPDCNSAQYEYMENCKTITRQFAWARGDHLNRCESDDCINNYAQYYALKHPYSITSAKQLKAICAAAKTPELVEKCTNYMSRSLAQLHLDPAFCVNTNSSWCFRKVAYYNKNTDLAICDAAGQLTEKVADKAKLKAMCIKSVQTEMAVAQTNPGLCTEPGCEDRVTKALLKNIRAGKPAQYAMCANIDPSDYCIRQLREQDARTNLKLGYCTNPQCFKYVINKAPALGCEPLAPTLNPDNPNADSHYAMCVNEENTRQARQQKSLLLCSTKECVDAVLQHTLPKDCIALAPAPSRDEHSRTELQYYEHKKLYAYCNDQVNYKHLKAPTIGDCKSFDDQTDCARKVVAHHINNGTTAALKYDECDRLPRASTCRAMLGNAISQATKDITHCPSRECFQNLLNETAEQKKLSLDCTTYKHPDECQSNLPQLAAAFTLDLTQCANGLYYLQSNCIRLALGPLYRRHLPRSYIQSLGLAINPALFTPVGNDIVTPRATTSLEWQSLIKQHAPQQQAAYSPLWKDPLASCRALTGQARVGTLALKCEQMLHDIIAKDKKDFRQCGTSQCVNNFIRAGKKSGKPLSAKQCDQLEQRFIAEHMGPTLQDACRKMIAQSNN